MNRSYFFILLLTSSFWTGCVTQGRGFPSDLSWIKKDKTKQHDVSLLLGVPQATGSSSGVPTWTYTYYQMRFVIENYSKELRLYWNPDGTVKHYSFSTSFPEDRQGMKTHQ